MCNLNSITTTYAVGDARSDKKKPVHRIFYEELYMLNA